MSLQPLPKKKNAVRFRPLQWLMYIHEVYQGIDSTLLERPDAIAAYNRLFDALVTHENVFQTHCHPRSFKKLYGLLPTTYSLEQRQAILDSQGKHYTISQLSTLADERYRMVELDRWTNDVDGLCLLGGFPHVLVDPSQTNVLYDLTLLYIDLFNAVRDVIEPAIVLYETRYFEEKFVDRMHATIHRMMETRMRLEKTYLKQASALDDSIERLRKRLDPWMSS